MTRYRTDNDPEVSKTLTKYLNGAYFDSKSSLASYHRRSMEDVVTPNFKAKIRAGSIINNPCSLYKDQWQAGSGDYSAFRASDGRHYTTSGGSITSYHMYLSGQSLLDLPDFGAFVAANLNNARSRALANIDPTPLSMLEDVAEIRSTLNLLRNPLGSLKRFSTSFYKAVKGRERSGQSLSSAIADVWLTYRFGFSPLYRSVEDVITNFDKTYKPSQERQIARGFSTESGSLTETVRHYYTSSSYDDFVVTESNDIDVAAGIMYTVSNPVDGFRFKYGFRVKDIPETIWAIVPYSFMVDRVFNLSDNIRGLTNLLDPNVKILTAWERFKLESNKSATLMNEVVPGYAITINGDTVTRKYFQYDRQPWIPTVFDATPEVNLSGLTDSATHVADLLSLIVSNLRGRR